MVVLRAPPKKGESVLFYTPAILKSSFRRRTGTDPKFLGGHVPFVQLIGRFPLSKGIGGLEFKVFASVYA